MQDAPTRAGDPLFGWTRMRTLLERRALLTPDRVALRDEHGRALTFAGLSLAAGRLADELMAAGIGAGDVVSWQLPTRISTVVLSAALCKIGAVQNPLLAQFRRHELEQILARCRSCALIVPEAFGAFDFVAQADEVRRALGDGPGVLVLAEGGAGPELHVRSKPGPRDPAWSGWAATDWIFTTSGTSAEPKGVRQTDESMIARTTGWALNTGFNGTDVAGVAFPWAHAGGTMYLAGILIFGAQVVLLERFDPPEAVACFRDAGTTVVGGSTVFYQAFLAEQRRQPDRPIIPSLRWMTGGAAPMPPGLCHQVRREMGVPLLHGYGSTESGSIAVGAQTDSDDDLASTVGHVIPGVEVRVVDAQGHGLGPGDEGEFQIGGVALFTGYTDPGLDAESRTDDGFFRTGDFGHIRSDGRLVVSGRIKDIVIRKGENISAQEVEEVLSRHPKVAGVAVIGVPDPETGERVCAVVELRAGSGPLTMDEMVGHFVEAGVMRQKIPERLEIVDELPRSISYGKVAKNELRARFAVPPTPTRDREPRSGGKRDHGT